MSKAKNETIKVNEPPKIPTLGIGRKPGVPVVSGSAAQKSTGFIAPKMRTTQSKGAGGK